jgi:hypothetical protein
MYIYIYIYNPPTHTHIEFHKTSFTRQEKPKTLHLLLNFVYGTISQWKKRVIFLLHFFENNLPYYGNILR